MGKLGKVMDVATNRADSWFNALTGLGNSLRDKQQSTRFVKGARLTDDLLETLYHEDDMAARVCEALPEQALRKGFFLSVENEPDHDLTSLVREHDKRLKFSAKLQEVAIWARVYGGAVLYLGINDGLPEEQPVNENTIKSLDFATVLDKRSITPHTYYTDALQDKKFGEVKTYRLNALTATGNASTEIHETRVIRMDGARTSLNRRQNNGGWSESVLEKVHETLTQFGTNWQAVGHLMNDAAQGVFKIDGLMEMIAGNDKDLLASRMEVVDMGRSVARSILLDAEREDFTREAYQFGGISDILKAFMLRLAGAARMPVMILMGQSPSGLNASGEGDIRVWYDSVQAYQAETLTDPITRFFSLLFLSADFEGDTPDSWEVRFEKLWQLTDKEQAELEKTTAEKDVIYIKEGVLLPEEVTINRFKAKGFSTETQVDLDVRKEMLDAEIELAKKTAGEPPLPPPMPGAPGTPAPGDPEE